MDDINAVLSTARSQFGVVRGLYEESLHRQQLHPDLQPLIKNLLENQRSSLDYLAERIFQKHGNATKTKVYYPLAKSSYDFPQWFAKNLPGVGRASPNTQAAIAARQPYRPGYDWLRHLNTLVIENKHRQLTPQTQFWAPHIEQGELPPEQRLQLKPDSVPPDPSNVKRASVRVTEADVGKTLTGVVFVDWFFTKPQLSALGTLDRIQNELSRLVAEVRQVAGV
jgi:hypothetical protein